MHNEHTSCRKLCEQSVASKPGQLEAGPPLLGEAWASALVNARTADMYGCGRRLKPDLQSCLAAGEGPFDILSIHECPCGESASIAPCYAECGRYPIDPMTSAVLSLMSVHTDV